MPLTRSRPKVGMGYFGPIPLEVWNVIEQAHGHGFTCSSNYARQYAPYVALAASLGWISNVSSDGQSFLPIWNSTAEGVNALKHKDTF